VGVPIGYTSFFSSKQCDDFMVKAAEIERKEKQEEEELQYLYTQ
jgi:hypothetical protein